MPLPELAFAKEASPAPPLTDRQSFFALDFHELDRGLTAEERQAWNSIYASYCGRSALSGKIIGAAPHSMNVRSRETGKVEHYGHDVGLTQRELSYTTIADLREKYHPGDELDCIVKHYNVPRWELDISVKETESNPFDGAELRHPVGSRRYAVIAGKYGGGVFCNLPDGTVCKR